MPEVQHNTYIRLSLFSKTGQCMGVARGPNQATKPRQAFSLSEIGFYFFIKSLILLPQPFVKHRIFKRILSKLLIMTFRKCVTQFYYLYSFVAKHKSC